MNHRLASKIVYSKCPISGVGLNVMCDPDDWRGDYESKGNNLCFSDMAWIQIW